MFVLRAMLRMGRFFRLLWFVVLFLVTIALSATELSSYGSFRLKVRLDGTRTPGAEKLCEQVLHHAQECSRIVDHLLGGEIKEKRAQRWLTITDEAGEGSLQFSAQEPIYFFTRRLISALLWRRMREFDSEHFGPVRSGRASQGSQNLIHLVANGLAYRFHQERGGLFGYEAARSQMRQKEYPLLHDLCCSQAGGGFLAPEGKNQVTPLCFLDGLHADLLLRMLMELPVKTGETTILRGLFARTAGGASCVEAVEGLLKEYLAQGDSVQEWYLAQSQRLLERRQLGGGPILYTLEEAEADWREMSGRIGKILTAKETDAQALQQELLPIKKWMLMAENYYPVLLRQSLLDLQSLLSALLEQSQTTQNFTGLQKRHQEIEKNFRKESERQRKIEQELRHFDEQRLAPGVRYAPLLEWATP